MLKINYDDHINKEIYKVLLMTNLVNVTVIRTQARHEAKRGVGGKKKTSHFKKHLLGLPWWLSGESSACQCRRCGFGKIPHTEEQLSQRTTTDPVLHNKRRHRNEESTHGNGRKSECSNKDPAKPKIN